MGGSATSSVAFSWNSTPERPDRVQEESLYSQFPPRCHFPKFGPVRQLIQGSHVSFGSMSGSLCTAFLT